MKTRYALLFLLLCRLNGYSQYQHDSIKTDKGYLHYYTSGKGEPIVHLQGGPGFSSYYMRAIADSLPEYRNILIDYQGTGLSQYKSADTSWVGIESIAEDIERVRQHLGIAQWIVSGHSYGTHFALYYATLHPEQVSRLVLMACAGTDNRFQRYFMDNISVRLSKEDFAAYDALYADSTMDPMEKEMKTQGIILKGYFFDKNKVQKFLSSIPKAELPTFYNGAFFDAYVSTSAFWAFDISKAVYGLTMPVRMIEGRQDPGNDGTQEVLNLRLKHSTLTYIEKSGHFQWVEQPQTFFAVLRASMKN